MFLFPPTGRKHAKEAMLTRKPIIPSKHFIKTYMSSFQEDPVTKISVANGDVAQSHRYYNLLTKD
jgi:hypothetical protein